MIDLSDLAFIGGIGSWTVALGLIFLGYITKDKTGGK